MTTTSLTAETNRTVLAALLILGYAMAIGFTDNFVQVIARDAGLWQFFATRTVFGFAILGAVAAAFGGGPAVRSVVATAVRAGAELVTGVEPGRVALVERVAAPEEVGQSMRHLAGGLVVRLYRGGEPVGFWENGKNIIERNDLLLIIEPGI